MQLQHELHHGLPDFLELSFGSLRVGSSKRFCLAPASKHVVLPKCFVSSVKIRELFQGGTDEIGP